MDRRESILKYITKVQLGIEVGPWFAPLTPKSAGYRCLTLDVADHVTLRRRASEDEKMSAELVDRIEEVDLVGSSTQISELVEARGELGSFDYIVSSHNFEHLPNPIRFLQGCGRVLKPNGIVSMAVPDRRACFDYFRPLTRLIEWLEAYREDRSHPTAGQQFDSLTSWAVYTGESSPGAGIDCRIHPSKISAIFNLEAMFGLWMDQWRESNAEYHDAHCSVFTPASFELLIRDCAYLGLIPFEVIEVSEIVGNEFHVHLRSTRSPDALRPSDHEAVRNTLLRRILDEASTTSSSSAEAESVLQRPVEENQSTPHEKIEELEATISGMHATERLLTSSRERIKELEAAISGMHAMEESLTSSLERIKGLEAIIRDLHASTSWQVTRPMRWVVTAWRALFNSQP